jgi:hypothetical protein
MNVYIYVLFVKSQEKIKKENPKPDLEKTIEYKIITLYKSNNSFYTEEFLI